MKPIDPKSVIRRPQKYRGSTRSLRPKREGLTSVVVDNNRQKRREFQKVLGKHFKITPRSGPEPEVDIDRAICNECKQPMGLHLKPEYTCP